MQMGSVHVWGTGWVGDEEDRERICVGGGVGTGQYEDGGLGRLTDDCELCAMYMYTAAWC